MPFSAHSVGNIPVIFFCASSAATEFAYPLLLSITLAVAKFNNQQMKAISLTICVKLPANKTGKLFISVKICTP
ncbi:MAG: hypothetical protein KME45_23675 [Stenomitos rutilans HA7619-LM2]|nr:hypothetical protein [Stenomitos rutilans HA7619-LM2]